MDYIIYNEVVKSKTAVIKGIDNTPPRDVVANLKVLVSRLNVIRRMIGVPLYINSGYRSRRLNREVGGAECSLHLFGKAADVAVYDKDLGDLWEILSDSHVRNALSIRELIKHTSYIHVGFY